MVYLPTFGIFNGKNVGKYTIHGQLRGPTRLYPIYLSDGEDSHFD